MEKPLTIKLYAVTVDCRDHRALAKFYADLLHWVIPFTDEDWAFVSPPNTAQGAYPGITFQRNPDYVPPVWPEVPQAQQQMEHMDFVVDDLEAAAAYAVSLGAAVSPAQFSTDWRVLFDPEGHPLCLCLMPSVTESEHFALL